MAKLKFDTRTPLYTSDGKGWGMEETDVALSLLYGRNRPMVIFVHGRGKEPNKSLKGASFVKGLAVPKIELGYDASVLMLNWDSAFPGIAFMDRTRALKNTPAGGQALGRFLVHLAQYQAKHPAAAKPVLLAHSMGSMVLQQTVMQGLWPQGKPLFRWVVLSQPDADDIDHSLWLSALGNCEQVFVTFNADDKVLRRSTDARPPGAHALGLGTTQALAQQVRYIDLTAMGAVGTTADDDHEVFGKGAMNGQVNVCAFFQQTINGLDVILDESNVASIEREVVYRLKPRFDPKAPCLKIPALPGSLPTHSPAEAAG